MMLLAEFETWALAAKAALEEAGAEVEYERRGENEFTAILLSAAHRDLVGRMALSTPPDGMDPQAEILIVSAETDDLLYMRAFWSPPAMDVMIEDLGWAVRKLISGDTDGFPEEVCIFWPPENFDTGP
jgi:hypothetical protein